MQGPRQASLAFPHPGEVSPDPVSVIGSGRSLASSAPLSALRTRAHLSARSVPARSVPARTSEGAALAENPKPTLLNGDLGPPEVRLNGSPRPDRKFDVDLHCDASDRFTALFKRQQAPSSTMPPRSKKRSSNSNSTFEATSPCGEPKRRVRVEVTRSDPFPRGLAWLPRRPLRDCVADSRSLRAARPFPRGPPTRPMS